MANSAGSIPSVQHLFLLFYTLKVKWYYLKQLSQLIQVFVKNGSDTERDGAGLSTRCRAQQMATALRKPFRCLLMHGSE